MKKSESSLKNELLNAETNIADALYRLLVISEKLDNDVLTKWITFEIEGYSIDDLPDYRKKRSYNLIYSGLVDGNTYIPNSPLPKHYLSSETLEKVFNVNITQSVIEIESILNSKDSSNKIVKNLTDLASEVYANTNKQVECQSIYHEISNQIFHEVYHSVKTRLIKIISSLEIEFKSIDKLDSKKIVRSKQNQRLNTGINNNILAKNESYGFTKSKVKNFFDKYIVSIIIGVLVLIIGGFITNLIF